VEELRLAHPVECANNASAYNVPDVDMHLDQKVMILLVT
jgi:hypothetical protein